MGVLSAENIISILGPSIRVNRILEGRISIYCPFHKGGKERKASMSIYLDNGWVICFSCGYQNPLDKFLMGMGLSEDTAKKYGQLLKENRAKTTRIMPRSLDIAAWVGAFRRFYPKNLLDAGFTKETLDRFQVGYDKRYRRVTYPIYDKYGTLLAIVGGAIDQEDFPKYKLYYEEINIPTGTSQGHREHLWGFHLMDETGPYVVVEGYKACMFVYQSGIKNVCATQGTNFTAAQIKIMEESWRPIKIFFDNDEPGIVAGKKLCRELLPVMGHLVELIEYPRKEAKQPDWLTPEEVCQLLKEKQ